ncbi:hypothetical protein J4Q44_G00224270 [Coregonus suidteri]|uniref:Uncharacterized protein n=1 Tax=Coregonus suidteri TaxID=861788 RepID=A0AAN8QIJ6_9TELE
MFALNVDHLEYGVDSLVMPIIRRHETLSLTHQDPVERLGQLVEELEQGQRSLDSLKQEHNTNKLMTNRELSELHNQWDRAKEKNKQTKINLMMHQGQSRDSRIHSGEGRHREESNTTDRQVPQRT